MTDDDVDVDVLGTGVGPSSGERRNAARRALGALADAAKHMREALGDEVEEALELELEEILLELRELAYDDD